MSEHKPRGVLPLNEFQQHIYEKYTRIRPSHADDDYRFGTLWFDSGVQHFQFGSVEFDDEHHADWFRRQLAKALASMATDVVEELLKNAHANTTPKPEAQ